MEKVLENVQGTPVKHLLYANARRRIIAFLALSAISREQILLATKLLSLTLSPDLHTLQSIDLEERVALRRASLAKLNDRHAPPTPPLAHLS